LLCSHCVDLPEMEFAIATVKLLIECAGFDPSLYAVSDATVVVQYFIFA